MYAEYWNCDHLKHKTIRLYHWFSFVHDAFYTVLFGFLNICWKYIIYVYIIYIYICTVHPEHYAHASSSVVLCWSLVLDEFIHILRGSICGTVVIVWLPQYKCINCQFSRSHKWLFSHFENRMRNFPSILICIVPKSYYLFQNKAAESGIACCVISIDLVQMGQTTLIQSITSYTMTWGIQ